MRQYWAALGHLGAVHCFGSISLGTIRLKFWPKDTTVFFLTYSQNPCHWFERVRPLGHAILLDSVCDGNHTNPTTSIRRYDIITAAPEVMVKVQNQTTKLDYLKNCSQEGRHQVLKQPVFNVLENLLNEYGCNNANKQLPFTGGLMGYWGYELNSMLEPTRVHERKHDYPDMMVGLYLWAIINDHQQKTTQVYFHPKLAPEQRDHILNIIKTAPLSNSTNTKRATTQNSFVLTSKFKGTTSRSAYNNAFEKIQQWITAGDCYQINLTQRFRTQYSGDPWLAYQHLRQLSPTPFSAFLDYPELCILSHSPERLLLNNFGTIESKPIKGTRPRGATPEQDEALAQELLTSIKDRAENLMIVDLLRNDLGRNCQPGSIKVPVLFGLESYANVHHMVSTIHGQLASDRNNLQLLRDAFPGGSITGAPKIRAMQIIREIESDARSVYCGAIGYISLNGRMDTNIPIRTLVADNRQISVWGGGAIVADSDCASEYEESMTKVRNLVNGLESAFLL